MDIYDYLKMDHKKVAKLFELYKTSPSERNKLEIIALIRRELTLHAESEENTFYKKLEQYKTSSDKALHGAKEHQEIKQKLESLADVTTINKAVEKDFFELKAIVDHHVAEEEGEIFKAAKKVLSEEEAFILKEQMHVYKEKMINHAYFEEAEKLTV